MTLHSAKLKLFISNYTRNGLEFASALSIILLGGWFMILTVPLSYQFLDSLAPLRVWGTILLLIGITSNIGLVIQKTKVRQLGLLLIVFARLALLVSVMVGTKFTSNTIPEHISWFLISVWAYWSLE